ncbi:nucleotide-diphospho-sugar transferase [Triangularia verruculosa]|uniref:Nucleotide-diphospho-sugar transferase n=1 Tax=Triangularia verruculosa TaxID=2587418 RepID=A0AAN6XQV0_9PEZI|nr:nucleotide-diphospho-sugar transferase [Triangularia verruculosa]
MFISSRRAIAFTAALGFVVGLLFLTVKYDGHVALESAVRSLTGQDKKTSFPVEHVVYNWTKVREESKFAYVQYTTDLDYLCNAMINFSRLKEFGTKHQMALIYPNTWDEEGKSPVSMKRFRIINTIRTDYPHINLHPSPVLRLANNDPTWGESITKFHAFSLVNYTRVLAFDSDTLVLNNMDHYFEAPRATLAVPRAYWLGDVRNTSVSVNEQILGSHVMLLEPNTRRYDRIVKDAMESGEFDMEVINRLFKGSAMILPHRGLALLTGEFKSKDHSRYLVGDGEDGEQWDAIAEVKRSFLVHFSDWPLPKPWMYHTDRQWRDAMPSCEGWEGRRRTRRGGDCPDRVVWKGFYEEHGRERAAKCGFING